MTRKARGPADRVPFRVRPMLATLVDEPFHRKGWVYEEKYDGYRILAYKEGREVTLYSRNAKDRTETFSEIARSIAYLSTLNDHALRDIGLHRSEIEQAVRRGRL